MSYTKTMVTPDTATFDAAALEELVKTLTVPPHIVGIGTTVGPSTPTYSTVSTPKGKTLLAKARMNAGTIERRGQDFAFNAVKKKLVRELLEQLMNTGVVKITSETSLSGSVTFTATVVANETA